MKPFLTASALLLCFTLIALGFFGLQISKEESTRPLSVVSKEKNEHPYIEVKVSRGFLNALRETMNATKEAFSSFPLFTRKGVATLSSEAKAVFRLFAKAAEEETLREAYKI